MEKKYINKIKKTFTRVNNRQEAGIACLISLIKYHGGIPDVAKLIKNSGSNLNGISLLGLRNAAKEANFVSDGYKGDIDMLKSLDLPVILHIERDTGEEDFIIVYSYNNNFIIGDPKWGITEFRESELEAVWKSKALIYLEPDSAFKTQKEISLLRKYWLKKLLYKEKSLILLTAFRFISFFMLLTLILFFFNNF